MKFFVFFICAIVAVQGFQPHRVEKAFPHHLQKASTKDLNDVIETIRRIMERIREIIAQIAENLPEILQTIVEKIHEIIENIPEIIQAIRDRIQQIIEETAEARQCVAAQREQIEALIQQGRQGLKACAQGAENELNQLREQLQALMATAQSVSMDILSRTLNCIRDNHPDGSAMMDCLREQVDPIREQLKELENQLSTTLQVAREVAEAIGNDLMQCAADLHNELAEQEQAVVNNIRECIQQS